MFQMRFFYKLVQFWTERVSNLTAYVSVNQLIVILFMPKGTKCSPLFILNANSYF